MTQQKTPVVQQMAAAPAPAVVEKAQEKEAHGDVLNAREEKALAAQHALDEARGYRELDVRYPNGATIRVYQALRGEHTANSEAEMIAHVQEQRVNAASPFAQG